MVVLGFPREGADRYRLSLRKVSDAALYLASFWLYVFTLREAESASLLEALCNLPAFEIGIPDPNFRVCLPYDGICLPVCSAETKAATAHQFRVGALS